MRKIITVLVLCAASLLARGRGFGSFHPVFVRPPVVVRTAPVYVGVSPYYGVYGYGNYWYPGYGWVTATAEPRACQKEKLKDAAGKKHEVLACKQGDGTVKIYEPGVK